MDELVGEFVIETLESLASLDQELVKFEQAPSDRKILDNIFRMMHTIKGTCGFLGLSRLEKIAHAGEDVLGKFRDGELVASANSVSLILASIDQIRSIIEHLRVHRSEGEGNDDGLIDRLRALLNNSASASVAPNAVPSASEPPPRASSEGFPVAAELEAEFNELVKNSADQVAAILQTAAIEAPADAKPDVPVVKQEPSKDKLPAQTIRVNVDVLESLMTLVSEMVLTRNQLLQLVRNNDDSIFKEPIQRLSRTTAELQEGVMKTRMQPIGNAWGKLPRIVRDLAHEVGKKINLVMSGEETELDRQVLELIQDPLTHMVRNSADHGLELPSERVKSGKDETGIIRLSAAHVGGHIIIEVSDDGRGINTDKIREKIIERRLATAEQVAALDDHQANQFILKPGFSTAEKVTKISGRGVGMDVVRSNIEKIGGTLEFRSVQGTGSTFKIKIPLTLAIIPSLIVASGGERFALPQIAVNEVVKVSDRSEHKIESLKGTPVLRLRDRLLPLVSLNSLLKTDRILGAWHTGCNSYEGYVVICRTATHVLGVIVDSISDSEEIVVKPLSSILGQTTYFAGNTILGDGRVILILDVNGLASSLSQEEASESAEAKSVEKQNTHHESILLFRTLSEGLKAVALSQVQRIENFDMSKTEIVQGDVVIQYRNDLLPIVSFDGTAGIQRDNYQRVLVFGTGDQAVGLAINAIVDIVSDELRIRKSAQSAGICGSAIVAGQAVDIADPDYFLNVATRRPELVVAA